MLLVAPIYLTALARAASPSQAQGPTATLATHTWARLIDTPVVCPPTKRNAKGLGSGHLSLKSSSYSSYTHGRGCYYGYRSVSGSAVKWEGIWLGFNLTSGIALVGKAITLLDAHIERIAIPIPAIHVDAI